MTDAKEHGASDQSPAVGQEADGEVGERAGKKAGGHCGQLPQAFQPFSFGVFDGLDQTSGAVGHRLLVRQEGEQSQWETW